MRALRPALRVVFSQPAPDPALRRAETTIESLRDLSGEHALLIGQDSEIMRELAARGCRDVTVLPANEQPKPGSYDVVIVASAGTAEAASVAIMLARQGLSPFGRIVVRTAADPSAPLRHSIERRLAQHGFSMVRVRRVGDRDVFTAELPLFGPTVRNVA
jgi:hypothetical protein